MHKIVFVILHYETVEDTKKCIESLVKYSQNNNVEIVVVDNGSQKGTLDVLKVQYEDFNQIYFLRSDKNLGFAKGNNIGYMYAKKKLKAEIIVLANNDIVFEQQDFIEQLNMSYENNVFDIAGPRIISLVDNKNQNPVQVQYQNQKDVNIRIVKYYILYLLSCLGLDIWIQKKYAKEIVEFKPLEGEDFQLHGACFIIGNKYLANYDGLYDKTFMYGEENILKYIVKRDNMSMQYLDNLEVYHKEGSSTVAIWGSGKEKRRFYYKWNIKGCKVLRELMQK